MNVIDEAMELIHRNGWWRGDLEEPRLEERDRPECVVTAIRRVASVRYGVQRAGRVAMLNALCCVAAEIPDGFDFVENWNDDPSTSFEEFVLVMKRASVRLDEADA